jgi:AcrR family transcriptional regulator
VQWINYLRGKRAAALSEVAAQSQRIVMEGCLFSIYGAYIKNKKPSTSAPVKARRPYQSTVRAQAALDTRRNILDTAMRLFVEHGYGKVTVADIAAEASLASPTVYGSTGGKTAILATLIEESMSDTIVNETLSAVRKSTSGDEIIHIAAHGVRVDNERYHDIVQVMKNAAAVDAVAADILARSDAGYREALAEIARRLRGLKALQRGITEARATDIMWFFLGHEAWHLLVAGRQWSWDVAEQWLTEQAATALLKP